MDDTKDTNVNNVPQTDDNEMHVLEARVADLENNWKRALADYRNMEKRNMEEKEALIAYSNSVLINKLLGVLDNLEMLENHIKDAGLVLTAKEFKQILGDEGLKEIDALNNMFDATLMEAVDIVEGEEDKVVEVVRKGYLLKDRLIRPARVKVGKALKN